MSGGKVLSGPACGRRGKRNWRYQAICLDVVRTPASWAACFNAASNILNPKRHNYWPLNHSNSTTALTSCVGSFLRTKRDSFLVHRAIQPMHYGITSPDSSIFHNSNQRNALWYHRQLGHNAQERVGRVRHRATYSGCFPQHSLCSFHPLMSRTALWHCHSATVCQ